MQILSRALAAPAAIELWQLPVCGTFIPEFQTLELGIPAGQADVWFKTSDRDYDKISVVNLNTGSLFLFERSTRVIVAPTTLYRSNE